MEPITAPELEQALASHLSISRRSWEVALPFERHRVLERDGALYVVLRLIVFEDIAGERRVRDIKEQEVRFVTAAAREEPERVRAWVAGWAAAVGELLSSAAPETFDAFRPVDLVDLGPLKLARTETADQFRVALLKKSRLGRWLVPLS